MQQPVRRAGRSAPSAAVWNRDHEPLHGVPSADDRPSARVLGLSLGALYVVFGVLEVVTHVDDTAVALAFWGLSLLGGGALVLAGTVVRPARRTLGLTLLCIGAVVATNATLWTVLVPIFAIVTVVAAFRDRGPAATTA